MSRRQEKMLCEMSATYVGSTSDIIATVDLPPYPPASTKAVVLKPTSNVEKLDEIPIRHRRLFFWLDKVSCLIVVFLVLAALTSRCTSSAYPSAAAQQFATLRTGGPLMMSGVLFIMCFHLLYSRRVDVPPPAHQTAIMTKRQRQNAW